jgi:hypothetical protein
MLLVSSIYFSYNLMYLIYISCYIIDPFLPIRFLAAAFGIETR